MTTEELILGSEDDGEIRGGPLVANPLDYGFGFAAWNIDKQDAHGNSFRDWASEPAAPLPTG